MDYELGNIQFYVEDTYEMMSRKAARLLSDQINKKTDSVIGFATGGTPVGTYEALIQMYENKEVDFSQITTFNLDEYYPIQKSDSQSYDLFMKENLFNHINIAPARLHIPNGEAKDIDAECRDYEQQIAHAGGIDLQILGIGLNGHIGFNEPAQSFAAKTHYVQLDESTIEANARFFTSRDQVPKAAVTMGIKTIMMARHILLLVNGEKKAGILKEMIHGPITPTVPASVLQLHPHVTIVTDKPAASLFI